MRLKALDILCNCIIVIGSEVKAAGNILRPPRFAHYAACFDRRASFLGAEPMIDPTKENMPDGWIFYTCDASLESSVSVCLSRDKKGREFWHSLPDEQKEYTPLYIRVTANSFIEALESAKEKARCVYL